MDSATVRSRRIDSSSHPSWLRDRSTVQCPVVSLRSTTGCIPRIPPGCSCVEPTSAGDATYAERTVVVDVLNEDGLQKRVVGGVSFAF